VATVTAVGSYKPFPLSADLAIESVLICSVEMLSFTASVDVEPTNLDGTVTVTPALSASAGVYASLTGSLALAA
jgi:hypothetical protein